MIKITDHPAWVIEFLEFLAPYRKNIVNHRLFCDITARRLPPSRFREALINFYPLIETFPKFMALNLTKVPMSGVVAKQTRDWLITNIRQERIHADWWKNFAYGFRVPRKRMSCEISPPPEIDALNNYLWETCMRGSLCEGISAANFAIEGPTGEWTKNAVPAIASYDGLDGIRITKKTLRWATAHAEYDDRHPAEALELVKMLAVTVPDQNRAKQAAKRAMEYYALALDAVYGLG